MSNTLTTLIPILIGSIQDVARNTGFLMNLVTPDITAEAAGKDQSVDYSEIPAAGGGDVVPAMTTAEVADITTTKKTLTLSQHKYRAFKLTAEDNRGIAQRGAEFRSVSVSTAVSGLIDDITSYTATLMKNGAGLAHGTPGTDPFASNPNILTDAWRTMADDRAPDMDRFAALSTLDYGSASKLPQFQKLNEAPRDTDWAMGRLGMLANWRTGYDQASGVLQTTTAAGGYLVNNAAGYPVGAKAITVDTGSGGFAAGDIITIAGSFEKDTATLAQYVVESFAGAVVTLTRGLITAVADNASVVRIATSRSSILAHRSATILSVRPSAEMPEGDQATIRQIVRDPVTGLALRLAYYPGRHMGQWEISAVFGGLVRRPEWVRRIIR